MKPTIAFPEDKTPVMTDVDSENDEDMSEPTGDLADLTASVHEGMPRDEDFAGATGDHVQYSGKGKGVGKGKSGSSGPAVKRSRKPKGKMGVTAGETSQENDVPEATATQTIMVGSKRGYTYYPAYLFDVPPKKLKIDHLRKKIPDQ